ncbi:ATPase PAAT-like isoform 2-T3 [Dugong dugon]
MEARTGDPGLTRRPTLASSWDAPCGSLTQSLFLSRGGLGAGEFDWEELLEPPAPGQDLVILKRSPNSQDENPCFLYLNFDPNGGEEIASIGILSSARNMEVYLREEYCGTSRGKNVCTLLDNSKYEKIILFKKYLKLESSTHACKIKNCVPFGEQLQSVSGNTGYKHMIGLQLSSTSGALDKSSSTPFPFRTGLTSGKVTEDLKAYIDKNLQPCGKGNTSNLNACESVPQSHTLLEDDLKNLESSFLPKKASDTSNIPNSELLPFLQNLCSQVNHLHVRNNREWQEKVAKPGEGIVGVVVEEQPVCSCLEKLLSKNVELMEKNFMDYIDQRICKLQEHIDNKIVLLMDLLQNSNSSSPGMPLRHFVSGERLSTGDR